MPQWNPWFPEPVLSEVNKAEVMDKLKGETQVLEQVFAIFVVDLILMELEDHRRQQTSHIWDINAPGIDPERWWTWPPGNNICPLSNLSKLNIYVQIHILLPINGSQ